MKKAMIIAVLIALPISLSGCDKEPEAPKIEESESAAPADGMSGMAMPAGIAMFDIASVEVAVLGASTFGASGFLSQPDRPIGSAINAVSIIAFFMLVLLGVELGCADASADRRQG